MMRAAAASRLATRFLLICIIVELPAVASAPDAADASEIIYSPWEKSCLAGLCLIGESARLASGCQPPVAAAVLVERAGENKKRLRVTVANDVRQEDGVRVSIDGEQPSSRPFELCLPTSCAASVEADAELIGRMKRGTMLVIEATSAAGTPLIYRLPLGAFAKAYDGPPAKAPAFQAAPGKLAEALRGRRDGCQTEPE
jgi:invasion protein IalB